ncbi:unnamed protein product, partial [Mesorhabditis belari]|uniref:Fukutin n=1 Tax=Mesorhabditis belari TaxID=2138241 RepID=A0AAF3FI29_9BILA
MSRVKRKKLFLSAISSGLIAILILLTFLVNPQNDLNSPQIAKKVVDSPQSSLEWDDHKAALNVTDLEKVDILVLDFPSDYKNSDFFAQTQFLTVAVRGDSTAVAQRIKEMRGFRDVFLFSERAESDYFEIKKDEDIYLMPRSALRQNGHVFHPKNFTVVSRLWTFGKKVNCLNISMNRTEKDSVHKISPKDVVLLAKLRDLIIEQGAISFLFSGTLLGWYRECSIIPHTKDMDIAIFHDEFPFDFPFLVLNLSLPWLSLDHLYGRPNDNYISNFRMKGETKFNIDIFAMYYDEKRNQSFITGLNMLKKMRYSYPRLEKICTADLLNFVFHVPCDPAIYLSAEYGLRWREDWPTGKYNWLSSPKNKEDNGKFLQSEKKEIIRTFPESKAMKENRENKGKEAPARRFIWEGFP